MYAINILKFTNYLKKAGVMNLLQLLTSYVLKFPLEHRRKNWKVLLVNNKSNKHLLS